MLHGELGGVVAVLPDAPVETDVERIKPDNGANSVHRLALAE